MSFAFADQLVKYYHRNGLRQDLAGVPTDAPPASIENDGLAGSWPCSKAAVVAGIREHLPVMIALA